MVASRGVRLRAARVAFSSGATFDAEIPATPAEMMQGLRNRSHPSPMLFVFPSSGKRTMTMAGVTFALDMIFLGDAGDVVDIVYEASPGRPLVTSRTAARYCLELPPGWAAGMGIRVGDRAMITPLIRSR